MRIYRGEAGHGGAREKGWCRIDVIDSHNGHGIRGMADNLWLGLNPIFSWKILPHFFFFLSARHFLLLCLVAASQIFFLQIDVDISKTSFSIPPSKPPLNAPVYMKLLSRLIKYILLSYPPHLPTEKEARRLKKTTRGKMFT